MNAIIDSHMHVGLRGDVWPAWGRFSDNYQKSLVFRVFRLYARIREEEITDPLLAQKTVEVIRTSRLDKVVCLALDHVFDLDGTPRPEKSCLWVANDYISERLQSALPDKILFGASIHPYDSRFAARLEEAVSRGAVLMKWLPSAQQIDLAESKTGRAMSALATARPGGRPLPLLLHVGPEYAIPSSDIRTNSYNSLEWTPRDRLVNLFRFWRRWHTPRLGAIHTNIRSALGAGAVIIFAHGGFPYFFSGPLRRLFEHSDADAVRGYLDETAAGAFPGRCFADVSAFATPFRKRFFKDLADWPAGLLLFGSDFPTPVFDLAADARETRRDFEAVLQGEVERMIIPEGNLIDVNYEVMARFFGASHPMFTNFSRLI